jgi:predicted MFS family arabinose efflux permease
VVLVPGLLTIVPASGYLGGIVPGGWRFIPAVYAVLLVVMAVAIFHLCPTSDHKPGRGRPLRDRLAPLRHLRVWRFGLYYIVVFGAYVALSAWLPKFYIDTYHVPLSTAALLTATFILPASLLRPLGGHLSDRWGPRGVTYAVFIVMTAALVVLSVPQQAFALGIWAFAAVLFVLGCAMGIGKASVYKYIPDYFPRDVGAVGGVVGTLGALGGFFLPPAFGGLARWAGSAARVPRVTGAHRGESGVAALRGAESARHGWGVPAGSSDNVRTRGDVVALTIDASTATSSASVGRQSRPLTATAGLSVRRACQARGRACAVRRWRDRCPRPPGLRRRPPGPRA